MAVFKLTDNIKEDLGTAMNLASDVIKVVLGTGAPTAATATYSAITGELSTGYGYTAGGNSLSGVTFTQTSGVATFTSTNPVITATGGPIGPFRYLTFIDDTVASPAKPVIGWLDYGVLITLNAGDVLTLSLGASGYFQLF